MTTRTPHTWQATDSAPYGVYVSTRPLDLRFVGADGEPLDGRKGATYRRLPTALVIATSPLFGALFVLAFPLIVAVAMVAVLWARLARHASTGHTWLVHSRYQPTAAYLNPGRTDDDSEDQELDELRREIDTRRSPERSDG